MRMPVVPEITSIRIIQRLRVELILIYYKMAHNSDIVNFKITQYEIELSVAKGA
jgi:hypothetical protein